MNVVTNGARNVLINGVEYGAKTGRAASYVIAASDAPTVWKQQADYVCDGTADNVEIQAAINLSVTTSYGGTVLLSPGTFTLADSIYFIDNSANQLHTTHLKGSGVRITNVYFANGVNKNMMVGPESNYATNVIISDMTLLGNSANQTGGSGIFLDKMQEVLMQNLEIRDFKKDGVRCETGTYEMYTCINVKGYANVENDFTFVNTSKITLIKCGINQHTTNAAMGIYMGGCFAVQITDLDVDSGVGANLMNDAIRLDACTNVEINGVSILYGNGNAWGYEIQLNGACDGINISNVDLYTPLTQVFGIGFVSAAGAMTNINISNCDLSATSGGAESIWFNGSGGGSATNISIQGNGLNGIRYTSLTPVNSIIFGNPGYLQGGESRFASGSLVPTGTCTATTVTGTFTESPLALKPGANTMTCTASGTINVVMPAGSTAIVTSGDSTVTDSPKTCPAGATTLVTVTTGAGADTFTITVHHNAFAWHNPEAQDILVRKVVINRTAAGGTATAEINVGIADNGTVDDPGTEFFNNLLANNAAALHDSYVAAGTSYGTQTIWVNCQDSASATGGWIVGKLDTEIANALAGTYYIEYTGK